MPNLSQEIRHAARKLRNSPGFTLVSIVTLALGIGATATVFSVVEAVLLRPLPFHDPDRLVALQEEVPQLKETGQDIAVPAPDAIAYAQKMQSFDHAGGYIRYSFEVSGIGEPVEFSAARLSANVFPALGVAPLFGRTFTRKEDENSVPVVVLSYSLWSNLFHRDANVLGKTMDIERKAFTIIGVMPRTFEFPVVPGRINQAQFWIPISFTAEEKANQAGAWNYSFVGRLKPGVTVDSARADANRVATQIVAGYPSYMKDLKMSAEVRPLKQAVIADGRPLVRVLFFAVIVVLLIACSNLAGLLLIRAIRRRHEVAVQIALGAPASVLVRASLFESLLISIAGGLVGVLGASFAINSWIRFLPETLPRINEVQLNWTVVAFAVTVSVFTGLLCGLAPAFANLRTSVSDRLKEGGRTGSGSAVHSRLRSLLVVGEIATALVLLTTAGLLLRSFEKMRSVNPGFHPNHLVVATYSLPSHQYQAQPQVDSFNRELLNRLSQLPGTESAALVSALPMSEPSDMSVFLVDGYVAPEGGSFENMNAASFSYTVGDYFRTAGIPLRRGRFLTDADDVKAPLVAVVNHRLAEHYWPGQNPLGKRLKLGTAEMTMPWVTVVGEVADTKQGALDSQNLDQVYMPVAQEYPASGTYSKPTDVYGLDMRIAVRTSMPPDQIENALRRTVWSLDSQLAVNNIQAMEHAISETEAPRRFHTTVLTAFALGAVLLAVIGIYGVIAFSVLQRVHEMAVRFALGAQPGHVIWLVMKNGLLLGLIGSAIGLLGAIASTRLLKSLLFEVSPFDPVAFGVATVIILVLSGAASCLPARRAASIDPMQLLRSE